MRIFSPAVWLQRLSVLRKFYVIATLIVIILLFGLMSFAFAIKTMSAIRAYVGGEGLWSKAQKEAVNSLLQYSTSHNEGDYDNFLNFLQVPLGDKEGRIELEKDHPNYAIVKEGFLAGGNHIADLDDMIFLFRDFRHVSYMATAIDVWTRGDGQMVQLLQIGQAVHGVVSEPSNSQTSQQLTSLLQQTERVDTQLTILENEFSATLGDGSRAIGLILLLAFTGLTIALGAFALCVAIYLGRTIAQVDKAKSEFVSLVSHQLRTPLTAISWSAELLLRSKTDALNERQKEYLTGIYQSNRRMINLVNSILNVSRIDLGGFSINPVPTDMQVFIQDILKELAPHINVKGIQIQEHYPEHPLVIPIDTDLFKIVAENLLVNALNYSKEGGRLDIEISSKKRADVVGGTKLESDSFLLQVSDNGLGIPKEQQRKIFTKLFRADNATREQTDGNGLGLYITKAILEDSDGSIWFTSEEGKGSTFYVGLPLSGMKPSRTSRRLKLSVPT